ncbi:uncharacterized protein LOC129978883 [Argiope bruennichi]|uniref:Uncharacterized protein n=1 Tax=Argiope bruennichi TaxID=94029 RepID=A0A8T0E353_ARGBR|nr:uncharacterized protein LOC129978883 [Argiope bruennichi]KAF8764689.1 hypothetical protein HNY73_022742 [Argiope bruennichi]
MRSQIAAILLVAVFSCEATFLPGGYGLGGTSYGALGLGYPAGIANAYAPPAYNPAPATVKVTYVVPSDLGNYMVVNDIAGAPVASYAVVDPSVGLKDTVARYVAPVKTTGNIAYVVKK